MASVIVLTGVITFITQRVIEPQLGKYQPGNAGDLAGTPDSAEAKAADLGDESRGLKFAAIGLVAVLVILGKCQPVSANRV